MVHPANGINRIMFIFARPFWLQLMRVCSVIWPSKRLEASFRCRRHRMSKILALFMCIFIGFKITGLNFSSKAYFLQNTQNAKRTHVSRRRISQILTNWTRREYRNQVVTIKWRLKYLNGIYDFYGWANYSTIQIDRFNKAKSASWAEAAYLDTTITLVTALVTLLIGS